MRFGVLQFPDIESVANALAVIAHTNLPARKCNGALIERTVTGDEVLKSRIRTAECVCCASKLSDDKRNNATAAAVAVQEVK